MPEKSRKRRGKQKDNYLKKIQEQVLDDQHHVGKKKKSSGLL